MTSLHIISIISIAYALLSNHAESWTPKRSNLQRSASLAYNFSRGSSSNEIPPEKKKKELVLLIDVDNTLYSEIELTSINSSNAHLSPWQRGIESQIIRNTHLFGRKYFNLTSHQCDELYRIHGSTIEGIRQMIPDKDDVKDVLSRFYKEVYDPIDFLCLFSSQGGDGYRSGYDHGSALQKRRELADFLKAICKKHSVYLCSNSPTAHIYRVMNGMGLCGAHFAGILAPDSVEQKTLPFPTKSSPFQYYASILERHPLEHNNIVLLDDSINNIRAAESMGIRGIQIGDGTVRDFARTLEEGLAEALGHILPAAPNGKPSDNDMYTFSDVAYLQAKNKVDYESIDPAVWLCLAKELSIRLQQKRDANIKVADLGAGMLSMLELVLYGGGSGVRAKESLVALIHARMSSRQKIYDDPRTLTTHLEYYAYETNASLLESCKIRLELLGFEEHATKDETLFRRLISLETTKQTDDEFHSAINVDVTIHLRSIDFNHDPNPPTDLDLIIGCCFADLFDPYHLTQSLMRLAINPTTNPAPLAYFPITFTGTTQFSPSHPAAGTCPSDTLAFQLYSESLQRHGHNLDPSRIIESIQNYGGVLIAHGQSKWIIDPEKDAYLWNTMLYFFGISAGSEMLKTGFDSNGWVKRSLAIKRKIIASNVDLLFGLAGKTNVQTSDITAAATKQESSYTSSIEEIQFIAPYNVTTIRKESHLGENQVEIEALCSLISSGTELKIFKGMFESAALDVNIKGMKDESMEYPLSYGYSLVGRVVACGSGVTDSNEILGRLVFVFSPHSSRVVTDRDAIQVIPDGIEAEDAIFMPSVETALSLVHDANVRVGENVAVYGQGLIGLLVTAILSMQITNGGSSQFGSVTTFDTLDDRLAVSSMMGATSALHPSNASVAGSFDVSIEVSGNPRALQSAIDNTSDNGRVIVGSWYGNSDVSLKLGIDFHRSHKTIQTSQVSNIPCGLSGLWSKERRFALTWNLVKTIRPSRLISKRLGLDDAQKAYELLDRGQEIAVCFKYT
jgi:NADPH:quinone reductase-like Zn-dependent oxidoreductase/FMN phosphatase YigB (HAD superfamily)